MTKGFFVESVAIEGFKGFTTRKEINLDGRHAFLLGQNGNGKSSIIEAVRWGLFGSARRRNEIIANRGYTGPCRVEIALVRDGNRLNLRRTLIRGASGGSDAVLTNELGQEQSIREVMPQLDSVDTGEGMHIIFAPQATPLRRQPEDLSAFERTVFNHLGLTHPRALLSQLDGLKETQEHLETNLGQDLTEARRKLDEEIETHERQRGNILAAPPWSGASLPSTPQSENNARDLITEITGKDLAANLAGLSLEALLDSADDALEERHDQDQSQLMAEADALANRRAKLENLRGNYMNIEMHRATLKSTQEDLANVLQGKLIDELRADLEEARTAASYAAIKREIIHYAVSLLESENDETTICPICEIEHNRQDLETMLHQATSHLEGDAPGNLRQLESQIQEASDYEGQCSIIMQWIEDQQQKADDALAGIDPDDAKVLPDPTAVADLNAAINTVGERAKSISQQIEDQETWFDEKRGQLAKLRETNRFLQLQRRLSDLRASKNRFDRVEGVYNDLVNFGESVRAIHKAIGECLNEQIAKDIPVVSKRLSEVFVGLTQHPWWDQLTIAKDTLPKLELRVASSEDPTHEEHPTGVLNGQSESALDLVPYFTFSQVDDAPTEVYLVMLDDPTRAFDEGHTAILAERLADLGRNVQLMVASHDTARFKELLPVHFDSGSYITVEPTNWTYHDGPELVVAAE